MTLKSPSRMLLAGLAVLSSINLEAQSVQTGNLPELPPFPEIPAPQAINSVPMADSEIFEEVQLIYPLHRDLSALHGLP